MLAGAKANRGGCKPEGYAGGKRAGEISPEQLSRGNAALRYRHKADL